MKRIANSSEHNIINDSDIIITADGYNGKKLDSILSSLDNKIEKLESNIKWLYKYGGTGSGKGGGSGETSFKPVVECISKPYILSETTENKIVFSEPGKYKFKVTIYRGGQSTYSVNWSWTNGTTPMSIQPPDTLTFELSFTVEHMLDFLTNTTLTIKVVDNNTFDAKTYLCQIVVKSYSFSLNFAYANDPTHAYIPKDGNIFMSDVSEKGLVAVLKYSTEVKLNEASYTYKDWKNESTTVITEHDGQREQYPKEIHSNTNSYIIIDLIKGDDESYTKIKEYLSDSNNAGFKQFTVSVKIKLPDSSAYEDINDLTMAINLVPSTLFLLVNSDGGSIHKDTIPTKYDKKFSYGSPTFKVRVYHGADQGRTYSIKAWYGSSPDDAQEIDTKIQYLVERKSEDITISINHSGQSYVKFKISNRLDTLQSYECLYYFYIDELANTWPWYPKIGVKEEKPVYVTPVLSCIYRQGIEVSNIKYNGTLLDKANNIIMSSNDKSKIFTFENASIGETLLRVVDLMFSVGILYSAINDTSQPILSFNSDVASNKGTIYLYQNKILIKNTDEAEKLDGQSKDLFIYKEFNYNANALDNYHLITIYKRLEGLAGEDLYKSTSIYIDGVLECVFKDFSNKFVLNCNCSGLTLYPGNYSINLIEYSGFEHDNETDDNSNILYLTENNILGYYYAYYEKILKHEIKPESTQEEKEEELKKQILYSSFNTFVSLSDNFIEANETAMNNIVSCCNCPVLLIEHTNTSEDGSVGGTQSGFGKDNFKLWISLSFGELDVINVENVAIKWSSGNQLLEYIKIGENLALFKITPLGSSTLTYRCKNFELIAPDTESNTEYIYSPNFNSNDTNTFLPEKSFTLKADVVDSSHTNNNAIASFVNRNSTKFEGCQLPARKYNNYIKNCLTGFPILIFLKTNYYSSKEAYEKQTIDITKLYFLGIYNFNLGRNSSYNLGYKNLNIFETKINLLNGFNIYEIKKEDNKILNGLRIAEVQGNDNYFDFSQSTNTILFLLPGYENDATYMYGDFVDGDATDYSNTKDAIKELTEKIALAGGFIFDKIKKTYSNTIDDHYGYDSAYSAIDQTTYASKNQVPNYRYIAERSKVGTSNVYSFTKRADAAGESDLIDLIVKDNAHLNPLLDFTSVSEYYTICMAFGLVDSVQKNLNLKAWKAANSKFYVAFYDMDTCLGIANDGSKTDYYAFSDYWQSKNTAGLLDDITVYRDFSPPKNIAPTITLYDTPSSYLFAIPKYAPVLIKDYASYCINHPCTLWAKWRQHTVSGTSSLGCLTNADSFMENYFTKHLSKVPYAAYNFNYKYKYLVYVNDGDIHIQYDLYNYTKFLGRKLAYTRDWLNSRLHILDAYFNICNLSETLVDDGQTKIEALTPDTTYVDKDNTDINVLLDIFADEAGAGRQYPSANFYLTAKAIKGSPIIIKSANNNKRLLIDTDDAVKFLMKTSGNQVLIFGGSPQLKSIDSINNFIYSANGQYGFTISSLYFTDLVGSGQIKTSSGSITNIKCSSWNLTLPSIKNVELLGPEFSGEIKFTNANPNLSSVNISNTAMSLTVLNAPIRRIIANNLQSNSGTPAITVSLNGDTSFGMLNFVQVNGTLLNLTLPAWQKDIVLPTAGGVSYLNCSTITMDSNFEGATFTLSNNKDITILSLKGFEKIVVSECPKLQKILIRDENNDKLKIISYYNSSPDASLITSKFQVIDHTMSNLPGIVNLSNQSKLEQVKFSFGDNAEASRCAITKVILPAENVITLPGSAFANCKLLTSIEGASKLIVTDGSTFVRAPITTLAYTTIINKLTVKEGTTNISYMFWGGANGLTLDLANKFLTDCIEPARKTITNILSLFYGLNGIQYGINEFKTDVALKKCRLQLNFPNVTTANAIFSNAWSEELGTHGVCVFNRYMLKGLGAGANVNINSVIYSTSCTLYATTDFLYEVIERISSFNCYYTTTAQSDARTSTIITFIDNNGNTLDTVLFKDIFLPIEDGKTTRKSPKNLTTLNNFEISNKTDLTDAFNSSWELANAVGISISYMFGCFGNSAELKARKFKIIVTEDDKNTLDYIFNNIKISSIWYCFCLVAFYKKVSISEEEKVWEDITDSTWFNIGKLANWNLACNNLNRTTNLFFGYYKKSLNFNKFANYISDVSEGTNTIYSFLHICDHIIKNAINLQKIGFIFDSLRIIVPELHTEDTEFYMNSSEFRNDVSNTPNRSIWYTSCLFNNIKLITNEPTNATNEIPILLTHDFLKYMPNLKYVVNAFSNITLTQTLPYDFFNKRKHLSSDAYIDLTVIKEGQETQERIKVERHYFDYTQDMTTFDNCFYNVKIYNPGGFDHTHSYNKNCISNEYLLSTNDEGISEVLLCSEYYAKYTSITPTKLETYTECTDLNVSTDYCYGTWVFGIEANSGLSAIYNFDLENIIPLKKEWSTYELSIRNRVFIAPDILYGATETATFNNVFSNANNFVLSTFSGAMPLHLLKNASKSSSLQNAFNSINILPLYFGSYVTQETEESISTIHKCYSFIPKDFTYSTNLTKAFNFRIFLPERIDTSINPYVQKHYYILRYDSITKDVNTLNYAFPSNANSLLYHKLNSSQYHAYSHYNHGLVYSIICNPQYGNPTNLDTLSAFTDDSIGFNTTHFKNLMFDNIVNAYLARFISGRIFCITDGYNIAAIQKKIQDPNNKIVNLARPDSGKAEPYFDMGNMLSRAVREIFPEENISYLTKFGKGSDPYAAVYVHKDSIGRDTITQEMRESYHLTFIET